MRGLVAVSVLLSACAASVPSRVDETTSHPSAAPIAPFAACTVYTAREPAVSREHHDACSTLVFPFYPPSSGPHYAVWAAFQTYDAPVPWGFLLHSLEHGAVVFAYDPASVGAADARALFADLIAARGVDPVCRDETTPSRLVVVPDPDLETPIAAVAWEHVYTATCLDRPSLEAFVDAHYGRAPEDLCFAGADRSATSWCP